MLPSPDEYEITPEALAALLSDPDKAVIGLIDCREEDEYDYGHLQGAELVPLSRFAAEALAKDLPSRELPLVIYCHHGMRSLRATHFLREKGKAEVWSLSGGIDLWSQVIDPGIPRY